MGKLKVFDIYLYYDKFESRGDRVVLLLLFISWFESFS